MEELRFVVKCLMFTMLMVVLMQVKMGGATIEARAFNWLRTSSVSQYIQAAAAGGAMALRSLGSTVKEGISNTVDGFEQGAHEKAIK